MILELLLILGFSITTLTILQAKTNYHFTRKRNMDSFKKSNSNKKVSVLVPARNEEGSIGKCVQSFLSQSYANIEIIVLNDQSTDRTGEILSDLEKSHPERLKVISGTPLEKGWMGKNWACEQLQKAATGDYLVFIDADVSATSPDLISKMVTATETKEVEVLCVFPKQIMRSSGEYVGISLFLNFTFAVQPLPKMDDPNYPNVCYALGQCMLFTRSIYDQIGGHSLVKQSIIEDVLLGRIIKLSGIPYLLTYGEDLLQCKMYEDLTSFHSGFKKNVFAMCKLSKEVMIYPLLQIPVFFLPLTVALLSLIGVHMVSSWLAFLSLVSIVAQNIRYGTICYIYGDRFGHATLFCFLYFIPTSFYVMFLYFESLTASLKGKMEWKGRVYTEDNTKVTKVHYNKTKGK